MLPVGLPGLLEFGRSVSFVADGEVIVLTECRQMAGWRVDTETEFRVSATDRECWQSLLVVGSMVLIACFSEWSLETHPLFLGLKGNWTNSVCCICFSIVCYFPACRIELWEYELGIVHMQSI